MHIDGFEVDLGPARRRSVLTLLLAARGRVVAVSDLLDSIWGDAPAASAMNQLHRQVGEIRRLFEPGLARRATGRWLLATPNGYRLDISAATCDLTVVTELVARAGAVHGPQARDLLCRALHVAGDPPFADADADIADHPLLTALRQQRVNIALQVVQAADPRSLSAADLAAVGSIAGGEPLNEPLQAALARALATAGRRAEALALLDHTRRALRVELGLDPSETLRAAQQAVLTGSEPLQHSMLIRPAQLPPRVLGFSDRPGSLQQLQHRNGADHTGRAVVITALGGMAGVGKTALAVDWAHRMADQYPDGQIYLNLRGFDSSSPPLQPYEALSVLLDSVGVSPQQSGESVEARASLFRSLVAGRKMLVVLDNARDSDQVENLLPGTASAQVIITSRNRLVALIARHNAVTVELDRLNEAESRDLLIRRLGTARVAAEPAAVADLIGAFAGLPLALAIVAARASVHHWESLRLIADDLAASTPVRLDALSAGEVNDVRAAFSWSYAALTEGAARPFRFSAAHPGPQLPVLVVSTMTGLPPTRLRQLLVELATASMITRLSLDRFTMHDLLRAYAGELLDVHKERATAESGLISHYRHAVRAAYLTYGRQPLNLLTSDAAVSSEAIADVGSAIAWYIRERSALYSTARLALAQGKVEDGCMIVLDARPMSMERDLPVDLLEDMTQAADAAERVGLPLLHAELLRTMGGMTPLDPQRGVRYIERAGDLFKAQGDAIGQVNTERSLSLHWGLVGDFSRSAVHCRAAVEAATATGRQDLIATTNSELGAVLAETKELPESNEAYLRALRAAADTPSTYLFQFIAAGLADNCAATHDWMQCYDTAQWGRRAGHGDPLAEMGLICCVICSAMHLDKRTEAIEAAHRFREIRILVTDDYIQQYAGSQWGMNSEVSIERTQTIVAELLH